MTEETQNPEGTQNPDAAKAGRKERMVEVILHYAVWDENGVKHPAAPVVGVNEVGAPVRTETTKLSPALAKRMVEAGKATVPLRD